MAQWHLDELENEIQRIGWKIISRITEGNDQRWIIKRKSAKNIEFAIFDYRGYPMPLEKAYACKVIEDKIHLYFYKKGKKWNENLSKFITGLNKLD